MKKENTILTIAVLAPVLLIGFFIATSIIQTKNIPDPKYNLLFTAYAYDDSENRIKLFPRIIENRLVFAKEKMDPGYATRLTLHVYDINEKRLTKLDFDPNTLKSVNYENKRFYFAQELQHIKLSKEKMSPDGYKFKLSSGAFRMFFGALTSFPQDLILRRGNKPVKLKIGDHQERGLHFIGWITEQ